MRELRIYKDDPSCYESLIYDQDKDSDSEMAMWTIDKILYELEIGDTLKIFCMR